MKHSLIHFELFPFTFFSYVPWFILRVSIQSLFPCPVFLNVYSIMFPCICLFIYLGSVYLPSVAVKWIFLCASSAEDCALRFSLFCQRKAHASLFASSDESNDKSHPRTTVHCGRWWWISLEYNVLMNVVDCSVFLLCILYR